MVTLNSFWNPAIAITQSTRSADQRMADVERQRLAEQARLRREAVIAAESTSPVTVPCPF
jgi:hypothetical protein